ncbi:dTDP-4-dehydrorhamnose reductase [uncultured Winogradskyella sp.]|uniref:dTDP-4-dehydrorhamnose reductase n=1 Tax=uncultured Winogradskyella sp. TaxID=395353 RepID=UPI0026231E3D|nr:dTDP-4-dehydrorhamnose reductase [uncultured Winogradskyella sp.]
MISVLVTGKESQLALYLRDLQENHSLLDFTFKDSKELNITSKKSISRTFEAKDYDYCINCAAYTAVDKAESESEKAKAVNTAGVKKLAIACRMNNTILIHISTDFVFDGSKKEPYLESDTTNPINVYGKTKRDGEIEVINTLENYFIIRTSWLYSMYGNNFVKTIIKLSEEKREINVVKDQFGSPTYAGDLINLVLRIILTGSKNYGLYHFSNLGKTSWYEFACQICKICDLNLKIKPISSKIYATKAVRPVYSVLSTKKTMSTFDLEIRTWKESLGRFLLTK